MSALAERWLDDLTDEELEGLLDEVLREVYVRAHKRSHPAPAEIEAA